MAKQAVFAALGLVIGLIGGVVLGFALAGDGSAPPARNMAADSESPACGGKPLDKPDKRDAKDAPDNRDDTRPQPTPKGGTLAEIIAKAVIPPVPSGDGEITGYVRTEKGEPLAGVTVMASCEYPDDRGYNAATTEERIAARIRHERWVDEARKSGTTGSDGAYKIAGLARKESYNLGAKADGWEFDHENKGRYRFSAGDTCDFVGAPVVELEIRVLLPDGSPAPSGDLDCNRTSGGRSTSTGGPFVRGGRSFTLGLGTWSVTATAGRYDEMTTDAVQVALEAGVKPEPVVLQLKSSPGIIGTIKHTGTFIGLRASVRLQANPPAEPPTTSTDEDRRESYGGGDSDSFKFVGLTPGTYRVILTAEGEVKDWRDVTISDALVEVELQLPDPASENYIIVRCYDPAGKLLSDVEFNITFRSDNGSSSSGSAGMLQSDGSYWLSKALASRLKGAIAGESWYIVKATSGAYGSRDVRYESTDTHEVEVRFTAPALVTLTVANFNDHPLRDKLRWSLFREGANDVSARSLPFRSGDSPNHVSPFQLGPQEPGEYFLVLKFSSGSRDSREVLRQAVVLIAGDNELTASVPVLYTLTISGDDESVLRRIDVRAKEGWSALTATRWSPKRESSRSKPSPPAPTCLFQTPGKWK